jgi:hypothetical protein
MKWGYDIWRHYLSTDVGFTVGKAFYVPEKDLWKLKVSWVNLGICHDPQPMGITQNIEIPGSKLGEWVRTEGRQAKVSWGVFR